MLACVGLAAALQHIYIYIYIYEVYLSENPKFKGSHRNQRLLSFNNDSK